MNKLPPPDSNPNQPPSHRHLRQKADGSSVGGIQGINGNGNTQIQRVVNQFFFNGLSVLGNIAQENARRQKEYSARQNLLDTQKTWIKGRLRESVTMVKLGMEEWSQAVKQPFKGRVWSFTNQKQKFPPGTKVSNKFDELGAGGTLLILGEPGSGKTTNLLELADYLIIRTEGINQPIPVVFNLCSWRIGQTIDEWLVQELEVYPYKIPRKISKAWVKNEQLLLLLDGLDEVKRGWPESCIQALNKFQLLHTQTKIVVCGRIKDYMLLSQYRNFQYAIRLLPLTRDQINEYINDYIAIINRDINDHTDGEQKLKYLQQKLQYLQELKQLLRNDPILRKLAKNPLMLHLMTYVSTEELIKNLPRINSNEEYYKYLFDTYIKNVLEKFKSCYSKEDVKKWLAWLAEHMNSSDKRVFLIERMQPNLLQDSWQKWIYYGGILIASEFIFMVITLITNAMNPKSSILVEDLVLGLLFGLMMVFREKIELFENLEFSWKKVRINFAEKLLPSLKVLLIISLIYIPICSLVVVIETRKIAFFMFALVLASIISLFLLLGGSVTFGLFYILPLSLRGEKKIPVGKRKIPNIGFWWSLKNARLLILVSSLIFSLIIMLICWNLNRPVTNGLITGILFGIIFGLFPAIACIQHLVLRSILCFISRSIPWKYAEFLDDAANSNLLVKVGGGYMFFHPTLQEHFAQIWRKRRGTSLN